MMNPLKNNLMIFLNKSMLLLLKMKTMMSLNDLHQQKDHASSTKIIEANSTSPSSTQGKVHPSPPHEKTSHDDQAHKKVKTRIQRIKMVKKLSPPQGRQLKLVVKLALQSLWNLEHYLSTRSLVKFEQGSPHEVN